MFSLSHINLKRKYMAMGKPIIASDIGQIGEILEHRKTGLLIKLGSYKDKVYINFTGRRVIKKEIRKERPY